MATRVDGILVRTSNAAAGHDDHDHRPGDQSRHPAHRGILASPVRRRRGHDPATPRDHPRPQEADRTWLLSQAGATHGRWLDGRRLGPSEAFRAHVLRRPSCIPCLDGLAVLREVVSPPWAIRKPMILIAGRQTPTTQGCSTDVRSRWIRPGCQRRQEVDLPVGHSAQRLAARATR
jgi:hypothetical protein